MKFKIGDKVKIVKPNIDSKEKYKNEVYTIIRNTTGKFEFSESFKLDDGSSFRWFENELELVKDSKKFFKTLPNNYTGNIEVKNGYIVEKEILDEVEKEYLKAVIRPFKNKVVGILKQEYNISDCYIVVILDNDSAALPCFKRNTMYKGMEINKRYTLKELGLDE